MPKHFYELYFGHISLVDVGSQVLNTPLSHLELDIWSMEIKTVFFSIFTAMVKLIVVGKSEGQVDFWTAVDEPISDLGWAPYEVWAV